MRCHLRLRKGASQCIMSVSDPIKHYGILVFGCHIYDETHVMQIIVICAVYTSLICVNLVEEHALKTLTGYSHDTIQAMWSTYDNMNIIITFYMGSKKKFGIMT